MSITVIVKKLVSEVGFEWQIFVGVEKVAHDDVVEFFRLSNDSGDDFFLQLELVARQTLQIRTATKEKVQFVFFCRKCSTWQNFRVRRLANICNLVDKCKVGSFETRILSIAQCQEFDKYSQ